MVSQVVAKGSIENQQGWTLFGKANCVNGENFMTLGWLLTLGITGIVVVAVLYYFFSGKN